MNFGPDVLHGLGRVKAQSARGVPQEAGDAEAHVFRIAEQHQKRRDHADDEPCKDHGRFFVFACHGNSPFSLLFHENSEA